MVDIGAFFLADGAKDDTDRGATTVPRRSTISSNLVVFMVALFLLFDF